jgi:CHAD domain-containing protein
VVRDYLIGCDAPLNIEPVGSLQLTIEIIELNQSDKGAVQLVFEQEYHKRAKGLLWLRVEPGAPDVGGPLDERLGRRCALTSVAGVDRERFQRLLKSRVVSKAPKKSLPAKGAVPPLIATIESILVKLSAQLHQTLDGTRLGVSDEPLHDFRIACQQIRVMLTLFSPPLIRTGALQSAIRELRTVLGVVRDCDVFLSRQGLGGIEPKLLQGVLHQRATARHELLKALQPTRIEPLLESIDLLSRSSGSWLSEGFIVARGFGQRLLAAERFGVRRSVERCRAFGHPQTLHSVRKSIKRARYATEWLGGKGSVRELKRYKALQKELGIFHDAIVAIDRLRGLGDDCGVGLREIEQRVGPLEQISREAQERFWLLWQKWFEP